LKTVLFLCTGNSARSILAEAYLNHAGRGRFSAHSAGSRPMGRVNPLALDTLRAHGIDPGVPKSKSWNDYANGPAMDLVITVCDSAAAEACPAWPGRPVTHHWSIPDPAARNTPEAFEAAFQDLKGRIDRLLG
jgi:arsenate reductase (thioredoxin)